MNLTEFFNSIRTYGDGSFSFPVLETFLTTPNNPDLTNFFDIYKQDNRLASSVDSKKYAKVVSKLLDDHKSYGGNLESITSSMQKNPEKMSISTFAVRNLQMESERAHRFTINVSGILLYDVVDKIYDLSKEMNYELDMEIPAVKYQKQGLMDTITIYSSNNNLFNTLDFIKSVESMKMSFAEQPKYYTQVLDGIAYDTFNEKRGKWNRDLVGEAIIDAIDHMIENYINANPNFYGEISKVNYKYNRVKTIRDIIAQGADVYRLFNEQLQSDLISKGVDPDDIFVSDDVYEKFFGPRVRVNELLNDEIEDLEKLIEEVTLGSLGDEKQDESVKEGTGHEEEIFESESGLGGIPTFEENIQVGNSEGDLDSKESEKKLGLKNSKLPLDPLDYLTPPRPTGNLMLLDRLVNALGITDGKKVEEVHEESHEEIHEEVHEEPHEEIREESHEGINLNDLNQDLFTVSTDKKGVEEGKGLIEANATFGVNVTTSDGSNLGKEKDEEYNPNEGVIVGETPGEIETVGVEKNITDVFGISYGDIPVINGSISEEPKNEIDVAGNLLADLVETPEKEETGFVLVGTPRGESEAAKALREFREKRAKEIALMEEKAKKELERVQRENSERSTIKDENAEKLREGNDYLEGLLKEAIESKKDVPAVIEEVKKEEGLIVPIKQTQEEKDMDAMLAALEQAGGTPLIQEGKREVASYHHEPSKEEERLRELENAALTGARDSKVQDSTSKYKKHLVKSVPLVKGAAEEYLEQILEKGSNPENAQSFEGFNEEMINETGEDELTPSDLFAGATSSKGDSANSVSDVQKLFEARVAALNATKDANSKKGKSSDTEEKEKISPEHARLNEMLKEAMRPVDHSKKEELKVADGIEASSDLTPSSLFNNGNGSVKVPSALPKEIAEKEKRYDAMLAGEYKEPPAVVIETPVRAEVVSREPTAEEQRMEKELEDLAKVNNVVEEETVFEGFEETALEEENSLVVVASPNSLISDAIENKVNQTKQEMTPEEDYLSRLLDQVYGKVEEKAEDKTEEVKEEKSDVGIVPEDKQSSTNEEKKETPLEEQRLDKLYEDALNGKGTSTFNETGSEEISHVPKMPESISAHEEQLDQLMASAIQEKENPEFTGFSTELALASNLEDVSGNQGLVAASLEEKIKQVYENESKKSTEERRLEDMLNGKYSEKPAVNIDKPEHVVSTQMGISAAEAEMDRKLADLEAQSPSNLFVKEKVVDEKISEQSKVGDDEISPSALFSGFSEEMVGNDELVASINGLFEDKLPVGVTPIMSQEEKAAQREKHFEEMAKLVGEGKEEEIEIPEKKKENAVVVDKIETSEFTGFETFLSDDTSEEERLSDAMNAMSLLELSSVELNNEETESLLNMDENKYQFVGVDMRTKVIDEVGIETTLFDYLESNNVLEQLKPGEEVFTVWGSMSTEEFIRDKLVPNVIINGNVNFYEFLYQNVIQNYEPGIGFGM